jgi:hypothetical protein
MSGDFKWPVLAEKKIEAPAYELWRVISSPGNLELCHPFCASNPVREWPGPDSRDEVHYLNGLIYERDFCRWIDGVGYDLKIGARGGKKSFVSWRISAIEQDLCELRITVYPYVLQRFPDLIRRIPHYVWLRPRLRSYLDSVVSGFDWYVTRGEPVKKNAFGTHPWFSPR